MKTNYIIQYIFVVFFILASSSCSKGKSDVYKRLETEVADVNKKCPILVNPTISMDSCVLLPNADMVNYYTVIDTSGYNDTLFSQMKQDIITMIKDMEVMKPIRDNNISAEYIYQLADGTPMYSFKVTPEDYKQK